MDQAKEDAKKEIEDAGNAAKDEVDNLPNLTEKEKEDAKKAIDEEVSKGKEAIDNAENSDQIATITNNTKKAIEAIVVEANKSSNQAEKNNAEETNTQDEQSSTSREENTVVATADTTTSSATKNYPKTGEKATGMISILGLLMLSIGAWVALRRKGNAK